MAAPSRCRPADAIPGVQCSIGRVTRRRYERGMRRLFTLVAMFLALAWALPASAQVLLSFHSFNGSMLWGRYPHAFIVLEGTLDANGQPVNENYGYSATSVSPAILSGNVRGTFFSEKPKYVQSTNRHFTMPISDAQYHAIIAEVASWRDGPDQKRYNLEHRNCVHFIARIAQMVGFDLPVPQDLVKKPRAYLNLMVRDFPALHGKTFG